MNCQYLVGGNGAGASASTKIEMNKTICTLAGDGLAPAYDSVPPDAHICQVEERRELSMEDTCTSRKYKQQRIITLYLLLRSNKSKHMLGLRLIIKLGILKVLTLWLHYIYWTAAKTFGLVFSFS